MEHRVSYQDKGAKKGASIRRRRSGRCVDIGGNPARNDQKTKPSKGAVAAKVVNLGRDQNWGA